MDIQYERVYKTSSNFIFNYDLHMRRLKVIILMSLLRDIFCVFFMYSKVQCTHFLTDFATSLNSSSLDMSTEENNRLF
jgi:hypothetical protein